MRIIFKPRLISAGPLTVLQHLYYYTVQYGLSVKQYTGKHQSYWSIELPSLLRKAQDNPRLLEKIIKELEELGSGYNDRLLKRREQLKGGKWGRKEIVINAQLLAVLAALPDKILGGMFNKLLGKTVFSNICQVVDLKLYKEQKNDDTDFVEPDLLLLGDDNLLMVEIKTCSDETSRRNYPAGQLLNYMRLVFECINSRDSNLPKHFTHLILVPTTDTKRWLEKSDIWVKRLDNKDGRLKIKIDICIKEFGNKYVKRNFRQFKKVIKETPIYFKTWRQLVDSYVKAINSNLDDPYYSHWSKIGAELEQLAQKASLQIK